MLKISLPHMRLSKNFTSVNKNITSIIQKDVKINEMTTLKQRQPAGIKCRRRLRDEPRKMIEKSPRYK